MIVNCIKRFCNHSTIAALQLAMDMPIEAGAASHVVQAGKGG
jgi:hypothetical protein